MTLEVFVCPKCGILQAQVGKEELMNRYICHNCRNEVPAPIADTYSLAEEGDLRRE